jgi:hypothetical protein
MTSCGQLVILRSGATKNLGRWLVNTGDSSLPLVAQNDILTEARL